MSLRFPLAALSALAFVLLAGTAPAGAATYDVTACTGPAGTGVNNSWSPFAGWGGTTAWTGGCAWNTGMYADLYTGAGFPEQTGFEADAPAGTTISHIGTQWAYYWNGAGWATEIYPPGAPAALGTYYAYPTGGWPWWQPGYVQYWGSWRSLQLVTYCASTCAGASTRSMWSNVDLTLSKSTPPAVALSGGGLLAGGWLGGTQSLTYSASDPTGIRRTRLYVDGRLLADNLEGDCDYSRLVPCANRNASFSVDTTALADGAHTVSVAAFDATDQNSATTGTRTFYVSNHPPASPTLSVDQNGWGQTAWTVRWTNPAGGDPAPVANAIYQVCRADGSACTTGSAPVANGAPGASNALTGSFGITDQNAHTLKLWLEDIAGNASPADASNAVTLDLDRADPGPASIEGRAAWLDGAQASTYSPSVSVTSPPPSGVAGYAVTTDGSDPGSTVDAQVGADGRTAAIAPPPGGWPEGVDTIRARAISGAGVASASVAQTTLRVDRTPPTAGAEGYGNPAPAWQPGPVAVRLAAADALSGMGAADAGQPPESGGRITYTLDTGPTQTITGGLGTVTVATAGQHWVTFRAYDVAGNASPAQTIYVNVGDPATSAATHSGFWAESTNAGARFTVARSYGTNCPAQTTLTPIHDTYVDEAEPDQAHGGETGLVVRSSPGANARVLLDFALPPANGCSITSARLSLYATAGGGGRTLEALRAGSAWTGDAVTWNTRPGTSGGAAQATDSASGWQALDVTSQVQDIYAYGDDGLLVRDLSEGATPGAGVTFSSSRGVAAERPQLVLTFG